MFGMRARRQPQWGIREAGHVALVRPPGGAGGMVFPRKQFVGETATMHAGRPECHAGACQRINARGLRIGQPAYPFLVWVVVEAGEPDRLEGLGGGGEFGTRRALPRTVLVLVCRQPVETLEPGGFNLLGCRSKYGRGCGTSRCQSASAMMELSDITPPTSCSMPRPALDFSRLSAQDTLENRPRSGPPMAGFMSRQMRDEPCRSQRCSPRQPQGLPKTP